MPLDPQVAEFYKNKSKAPVFGKVDIRHIRAAINLVYNARKCLVPLPLVENTSIISEGLELPIRIYYPIEKEKIGQEGLPIMLFFHGGAFIVHNVDSHDNLCRKLAQDCGCIVASVEYRLAPEYKHPAQLIDAVSAFNWVRENYKQIGANPEKIIPAGDSAGATLAVDLALYAKKHNISLPLMVLYYGYFGCSPIEANESYKKYGDGSYGLSPDIMEESAKMVRPENDRAIISKYYDIDTIENEICDDNAVKKAYDKGMDDVGSLENIEFNSLDYLTPGIFPEEELTMDTKSLIVLAECDPLRDDGWKFAEKMKAAGNDVTLLEMSGMIHGFMVLWHKFDRCQQVFEATAEAVRGL